MATQNVHNQDLRLVLSGDAKPRLKWTPELHQRFIDVVNQLGGADKATPKSLMRMMDIHGLTLYHLKSHLQKYRLGKSQQSKSHSVNTQEEEGSQNSLYIGNPSDEKQGHINDNEHLQIAKALQMQMGVQRKLHEQIEVQRHLQLRIEAQGKYLQLVLLKAQETLSQYSSFSKGAELAKAELSQIVSMVETGCASPSLSGLTDIGDSVVQGEEKKTSKDSGLLLESSSTSSDSSGKQESKAQPKHNINDTTKWNEDFVELSLMKMQPGAESGSRNQSNEKKRRGSTFFCDDCVGQPSFKRLFSERELSDEELRRVKFVNSLDLNSQCLNDTDSDKNEIDLNLKEAE